MRRCIVTGATRGIGAQLAIQLRADGYEVIGLARSRPGDWTGSFIECDLTDKESIEHASGEIAKIEELWALINNAGIGRSDPIPTFDYDDMQMVFGINAIAPAMLVKASAPRMLAGGRIVNVCSNVYLGKPERTVYGASKAALASMTRTWALELAPHNILVNAVSPGPVDTTLFRRRNPAGSANEEKVLSRIPLNRVAEPSDVADLIEYLVRPENRNITGQILTIDGGGTIASSSA